MTHSAIELSGVSSLSDIDKTDAVHHFLASNSSSQEPVEANLLDIPRTSNSSIKERSSNRNINKLHANYGVPPLHPDRLSNSPSQEKKGVVDDTRQEKYLVDLLQKASQVIKDERARSAALQREVDELRQSTTTNSVSYPIIEKLQKENKYLKKQIDSLREQLEGIRSSNLKCKPQYRMEQRESNDQKKKRSISPSIKCPDGVSPKQTSARTPLTPFSTNIGRSRSYSDSQHTKKQTISLQRQRLLAPSESLSERDSIDSQNQNQHHKSLSTVKYVPPPLAPQIIFSNLEGDNKKDNNVLDLKSHVKLSSGEDIWRATSSNDNGTAYNVGMITRLRRAMAPQPTKEQLGEVIHAMVQEIVRDARRRGLDLQVTRQAPCVYRCCHSDVQFSKKKDTASRVLHLSIDSGRLTVKVGGGHVNFLDYLERYRLTSGV